MTSSKADYNDYEIADMLPRIDELIQQGCLVFLKWTCPWCEERVTASEPNVYRTEGYLHEDKADGEWCGSTYYGTRFNYVMVFSMSPAGDEAMEQLKKAMEG